MPQRLPRPFAGLVCPSGRVDSWCPPVRLHTAVVPATHSRCVRRGGALRRGKSSCCFRGRMAAPVQPSCDRKRRYLHHRCRPLQCRPLQCRRPQCRPLQCRPLQCRPLLCTRFLCGPLQRTPLQYWRPQRRRQWHRRQPQHSRPKRHLLRWRRPRELTSCLHQRQGQRRSGVRQHRCSASPVVNELVNELRSRLRIRPRQLPGQRAETSRQRRGYSGLRAASQRGCTSLVGMRPLLSSQ